MIPDPTQRPLLTIAEARAALGGVFGRSAFYSAVARGEVPGVIHLGRRVLVSTAALRNWVGLDDAEAGREPSEPAVEGPVS